MLKPLIKLLCIALCTAAQAETTAETDAAFQYAIRTLEANQQWISLLLEQESTGYIDKQKQTQAVLEVKQNFQTYEDKLRKASAGGHGVATYLLANLQEVRKILPSQDSKSKHSEACALYQIASDQGLVAGAVALFNYCENAFERFKDDDPEFLRLRDQLIRTLEQPDPYQDYYPLPALRSFCFKEQKMIAGKLEGSLTALMDFYTPVHLSLEQFRADGYYLLTAKGDITNPKAREYFIKMQTLTQDCLDPLGKAIMFKVIDERIR